MWFSFTLEESMNVTDTAQQLLLFWKVNGEFEIPEELTSIDSLCGRTVSDNMSKEVEKVLIHYNLKWNVLGCIIRDGGINMYRVEKQLC